MTRAEYIRETQYNRRKRRILRIVKRTAVGLGCLVLTFLVCCGCVFVWDTFWGKEEGSGSNILAANAAQTSGTVIGIQTDLENAGSLTGGQGTVLEGESGLAGDTQTKGEDGQVEETLSEEPKEPTVVVDAGHGGNDGGTYSGKIIEKDITLAVAKKMKKLLEEQEINVIMTRETDEYLELKERTQISNENDTDLFISVHCNYYEGGSEVKGIECYYAENDEISKEVAEIIMKNINKISGLRNRGAKEEDFFVTEFNDAPAVLVEMGFLSNPTECKNLADSDYQQSLAEELVEGILQSLEMLAEETTEEPSKESLKMSSPKSSEQSIKKLTEVR